MIHDWPDQNVQYLNLKAHKGIVSLFKDGTKTLLKIDLKNWLMTEAGTGCMQRLMSPVQCLYIRFGHTEWINKTSPLWLSPYPVTVLSLFLLRPEPSSENSLKTHAALCCQTHNMHTLPPSACSRTSARYRWKRWWEGTRVKLHLFVLLHCPTSALFKVLGGFLCEGSCTEVLLRWVCYLLWQLSA